MTVFVPVCCSLFKVEGPKHLCMLPHLILTTTFWNGDYYLYLTHEETEVIEVVYPRHLIDK